PPVSLLLKDKVWSMEASTAKRGVYPLHGYKLGLYRIPVKLDDPLEIRSVHDGLKKTFEMDMYADRIFATYTWKEQNSDDPDASGYEEVDLSVTVEVVTGEVVDIIYQIFPIERFGDPNWVSDYRRKADHFAKMVIDTILRNTILADKMVSHYAKTEKISEVAALQKLEDLTPLAKIVLGAKAKAVEATEEDAEEEEAPAEIPDGAKPGPIDIEFKSKVKPSAPYEAPEHTIKTWGRRGTGNAIMGVWGEFVSVDYDICVADGGCIEACPVSVYEWFDTPGNPASGKKPLMSKEPDCIFCLACEGVCPPQAIKIFEQK
ncbi:MAG: ferredoxin family protein, partial [Nitrosopumilus sp.]|nr:ferredoxin family protein [Nitrosopumilus sp.]MDA7955514.1 ferredoxin family protein [Nitrosopumilus sp.]MDA7974483.1 ferredoxin family protein [Nitrosopumilus sp.]